MKIGVAYLLLAGLLTYGCLALPGIVLRLLSAWSAIAVLLVGTAYLTNYARIFRKGSDGSIPLPLKLLFLPMLLVAGLINRRQRRHDPVPALQKIDDDLYLGCRLTSRDIDQLKDEGICAVLDVTSEFDGLNWSTHGEGFEYLNVPILDHAIPSTAQLNQCINWTHRQIKRKRPVLIHCALGRGRSVLVLMAYLLARNPQETFEALYQRIRAIRQTAELNGRQFRALQRWVTNEQLKLTRRMALVVNQSAMKDNWPETRSLILESLSPYAELEFFEESSSQPLDSCLQSAIESEPDILIGCGGDGTLSAAAAKLAGTDIALGIIPVGTANALAASLLDAGPLTHPVRAACETLVTGEIRQIDTALCNGSRMILLAGIGIEYDMTKNAEGAPKEQLGQFAYVLSFFRALSESQPADLQLQIDDEELIEVTTRSLVVANAAPLSSIMAQGSGTPHYQDGKLDVTWIQNDHPLPDSMGILELLLSSNLSEEDRLLVEHRQAQKIRITASHPLDYVRDGENCRDEELDIQVDLGSLRVVTPARMETWRRPERNELREWSRRASG